MTKTILTATQMQTIRHALEVAAERFVEDAKNSRAIPGFERIAEQFERQVAETREVLEHLENSPQFA